MSESGTPRDGHEVNRKPSVVRGLMFREWLLHRHLVLNALTVWLVCGYVLLAFFHPGCVLAFSVIYAILAGSALGGSEAREGSEEFSFSLPPPRADRYLVRLSFGLATVLGFSVLGLVTVGLEVPQKLWGLVVESGYTAPFLPCTTEFLYHVTVLLPFAVFSFTFAFAAVAGSPAVAQVAWFNGTLGAGLFLGMGLLAEHLIWDTPNGLISCPALAVSGAGVLLVGYLAYVRKEGISRPASMHRTSTLGIWIVLGLLVVFLFMALLSYSVERPENPPAGFPAAPSADTIYETPEESPAPGVPLPGAQGGGES